MLGVPLALGLLGLLVALPGPVPDGSRAPRPTSHGAPPAPTPPTAVLPDAPAPPEDAGAELAHFADTPSGVEHDVAHASGDLPEDVLEQIAKLEAKIAKDQATILKKQASLQATKGSLTKASPGSLAKKLKKIKKLMASLAALAQQIQDYQDQIDVLEGGDPGGGDPGGGDPTSTPLSVPLLVQEVLPAGAKGFARPGACATFGMPFKQGDLPQVGGRPGLSVHNSPSWQARTLSTWPDGSVQWALVDAVTDVPAGGIASSLELEPGAGLSGGAFVASESGNTITLDTGALQATVLKSGFNLFDTLRIGGTDIVAPHASPGILGKATDGQPIVPRPSSLSVAIEENGPARAVVRVLGTLMTGVSGTDLLDFTCRITARRGSADVQVDFTVRNATILRPKHVVIEGLGLVVRVLPGASPVSTLARHDGQMSVPLAPGGSAWVRQAYSAATTTDVTGEGSAYLPPIPKTSGTTLAEEGYEIKLNGLSAVPLGNKNQYPPHGFVDLTGASGGVTLSLRQMPYFWPACLETWGTGDVVAGLWTDKNIAPYTFCWRQHESRTVSFSFHKGAAPTPLQAAERLDWPVNGRAADYDQYDSSGVFAYRLMTLAEQNELYAMLGMNHTVAIADDSLSITRFLAAHNTGGTNNHDSIERRLAGEWLRQGLGGQWLNAMDLAMYKAEWQILRSDDFDDKNDPGAINDQIPHTVNYEGDLEHRYRDGMVLAYDLTGDPRLRDALYDEEEILAHLANTTYERSFYQSVKALSAVGRFTDSQALRDRLHGMLEHMITPVLNVNTMVDGYGWQTALGQTGNRRYYVFSAQNADEKPPGENYVTRGFITACLGPIAYFNAYSWLGADDPDTPGARQRLQDLAYYTRKELFPYFKNPKDRHLVYAWAVRLKKVVTWEEADFHPILLGMAESYLATGDAVYLAKGLQQVQAFAAHDQGAYKDNLYLMDTRLDAQHYMSVLRDYLLGIPPP
ncbi:MAG TPA: hypothetical protein VFY71_11280 [Planctomycetota bacterium]|nr:hypothetical protein [Planctomycetota bacterium]